MLKMIKIAAVVMMTTTSAEALDLTKHPRLVVAIESVWTTANDCAEFGEPYAGTAEGFRKILVMMGYDQRFFDFRDGGAERFREYLREARCVSDYNRRLERMLYLRGEAKKREEG